MTMNHVKNAVGAYVPTVQQSTLAKANLIDTLLGSGLGTEILSGLVGEAEVSPRNLSDRLRVAIRAGALPLTPKRLQKLQAALELGRQLYVEETPPGDVLDDPYTAAAVFNCIAWEPVEKFAIACMDVKHRLLSCCVISSGTATETCVHPREVFSAAMRAGGTRCIVAHNHPSGSTEPSKEDIELTKQLLAASKVMGIPILDHLVVSRGASTSLRTTTALWQE